MGKYSRRRFQNEYKRAGFPFPLAVKLARFRDKGMGYYDLVTALGPAFEVRTITYCECCGPEATRITFGKTTVEVNCFTLAPR